MLWDISQRMNYRLTIEIPGLPKTVNALGRAHWSVKVKHNNLWFGLVQWGVIRAGKPKEPLKKALVTLTRYSSSEPDFDGLTSSFKCILDSLIKCGVLEDDKMSVIGQPTYVWEKCKRDEGKIKIEVVED